MVAVIAALGPPGQHGSCEMVSRGIESDRLPAYSGSTADVVQPTPPSRHRRPSGLFALAMGVSVPYPASGQATLFKGLRRPRGRDAVPGRVPVSWAKAAGGFHPGPYSRTLHSGEWVRIGDVEGAVVSVERLFQPRSGPSTDEEVSVPNTVVLTAITRNFSRPAASEAVDPRGPP